MTTTRCACAAHAVQDWQKPAQHDKVKQILRRRIYHLLEQNGKTTDVVKCSEYLENRLYYAAASFEEYQDLETLKARLQLITLRPTDPLFSTLDALHRMVSARLEQTPSYHYQLWLHILKCSDKQCSEKVCLPCRNLLRHRCTCRALKCPTCCLIDLAAPGLKKIVKANGATV
jgi:hypothetical protein